MEIIKKHGKHVLFVLWLVVIAAAVYGHFHSGIPVTDYPQLIQDFIAKFGFLGPLIYIAIYTIRPITLFPGSILTAVSGLVWGPWLGLVYTMIGATASANAAFMLSRYFGRDFVERNEGKSLKKLDTQLRDNGFITVLLLRLLFFPFDLINFLCGLSSVRQRDFTLGTIVGILPGTFTFVLFGSSITDPRNLGFGIVLFLISLVFSIQIKKRNEKLSTIKENLS